MQSGNGLEASKATTAAVDQPIHVVMLGYILAVLSSYCPWYQYIDYDTNFGLRASFVFLGDWGWAFALGDAWTGVLFICRQVLFLGGLLGGLVTTILSQVFEHRRGSLYLAAASLSVIILPAIAIPSLLVFLHGFPPHEFFGSIPEMHPIGEGFACGFFASLASAAFIFTAAMVMLDYAPAKKEAAQKRVGASPLPCIGSPSCYACDAAFGVSDRVRGTGQFSSKGRVTTGLQKATCLHQLI